MTNQLTDAYAQLKEQHPDLFKGCPAELPGDYKVIKNETAREFDRQGPVITGLDEWDGKGEFMLGWQKPGKSDLKRNKTVKLSAKKAEEKKQWVEENKREDLIPYHKSVTSKIERDYLNKQDKKDKAYITAETGTGEIERNVVPFDGHQFRKPKVICLKPAAKDYQGLSFDGYTRPLCDEQTCLPGPGTRLENGLKTQLKEFGKRIFIPVGRKGQSKKYEKKEAALVNALSRAFSGRDLRPNEKVNRALSLDTCPVDGEDSLWLQGENDITKSHCCCPMFLMEYEEEQKRSVSVARYHLGRVREHLGAAKWDLLMESLQKTNAQIAAEINAAGGDTNTEAIKKSVQRIRKALRQLACPF